MNKMNMKLQAPFTIAVNIFSGSFIRLAFNICSGTFFLEKQKRQQSNLLSKNSNEENEQENIVLFFSSFC